MNGSVPMEKNVGIITEQFTKKNMTNDMVTEEKEGNV